MGKVRSDRVALVLILVLEIQHDHFVLPRGFNDCVHIRLQHG